MVRGTPTRIPVYIDARALQDPNRRTEGLVSHLVCLLRSRKHSAAREWRAIGIIDDRMDPVSNNDACLLDELTNAANPVLRPSGNVFIHVPAAAHETRLTRRFAKHSDLLTAAVVDDAILRDYPGQLTVASRMTHISQLARLRKCDIFLPLSQYSALQLQRMLGISNKRITVTGACGRRSLLQAARRHRIVSWRDRSMSEKFFITAGSDDRRSDTEAVMRAIHRARLLCGQRVRLKIVGRYSEQGRKQLQQAACELGDPSFIEVVEKIDDDMLAGLYAATLATIIPSENQGFALPVIEAWACHSLVLASRCPAHVELIEAPEALFTVTDVDELTGKLIAVLNDSDVRSTLFNSQMAVATHFTEEQVGARFWDTVVTHACRRFMRPTVSIFQQVKPRLAILSPFPPEQSGCARFTERTIEAARVSFDIDLFTNAPRPLKPSEAFRDAGIINAGVLGPRSYAAVVSVLGNSRYHDAVADFFERFGGPCIMHDSRLTQVYHNRLGKDGFIRFASTLLQRTVSEYEVENWLEDRSILTLFVEPIITRAAPLIVHTKTYQRLLKERYGCDAQVATFPPSNDFSEAELSRAGREAARQRCGFDSESFVISTFGYVHRSKGAAESIKALSFLRSWNIPAQLYFVGAIAEPKEMLLSLMREVGVEDRVHFTDRFVDETTYRDFLIGSDAGIALRTYGLGQPSAALTDCIAAALATVATVDLAETCESPSYVKTIDQSLSPLRIAEELAGIRDQAKLEHWWRQEREEYLQTHSFAYYVQRLHEILGV